MYLWGLVVIISLGLLGCNSKEVVALQKSHQKKASYHKALQKTEKAQLYQKNFTKVMLTATYLYTPTLDKNDTRPEVFIIGMHHDDNSTKAYTLTLNGKKSIKIQTLAYTDKRLKHLSFITQWGEYSLVSFPHSKAKKVILTLQSPTYGKTSLYFSKVAKYVLEKKKVF